MPPTTAATGALSATSRSAAGTTSTSRALASSDFTKSSCTAGPQLPIGPSLTSSQSARSIVSLTGRASHAGRAQAARNRISSASSLTIRCIAPGQPPFAYGRLASDGAHLEDFRDVVAQHVLDAGLQGRGRARASRAGALHVQIDDAVLEILEGDVAAVHRHCRPQPRLQQLLDLTLE